LLNIAPDDLSPVTSQLVSTAVHGGGQL